MDIHGAAAREIRKARGLGLRETARAVGIDDAHMSRVERGIKRGVRPETATRWADHLAVPIAAITRPVAVITEEERQGK
jgi:transcriptional regulator with XRE-family HTH domain